MVSYTGYTSASSATSCEYVWHDWVDQGTASSCNGPSVWADWTITSHTTTYYNASPKLVWRKWKNDFDFSETNVIEEQIGSQKYTWVRWIETYETSKTTPSNMRTAILGQRFQEANEERRRTIFEINEEVRRSNEEAAKRVAEREKKLQESEKIAKLLLEELIGRKEIEKYEKTGRLMVVGKKGTFILNKSGYHQFIAEKKMTDLCIHLQQRQLYPPTDNVIGLAAFLRADESGFLKMANKHGVTSAPLQLPECATLQ